ncbi:kinase-like protein, partial [Laetiporus sulphureus 93-53]
MPASSYIPNLTGCTIDHGHLKLLDVLGSGSSGVVYLAEDTTTSAEFPPQYAVKCMLKAEEGSVRDDAQRNEIYNHMLVSDHPNIVTLHGVIVDSDLSLVFLILDYCPGGDLFKLVLEGRITPGDDIFVRRTLLQLMDALDACHQQGIFHRDIKLENIMCSTDGSRMFLCDFGLSTRHSYSTSFGAGSHLYMSPECIGNYSSHPYSTRANDVWALGVIMTAMITEHNPWRKAIMEDGCYRAYQKDGEYLRKSLPISSGASIILQRIFTQESNRITVPYLRLMVLRTDTFF